MRALPTPVETSAATLGSASRWTIIVEDESYRPEETGTTLFANASQPDSWDEGGKKGMGDLATREEPEASLGRTWKLESGCAAKGEVPYPKYTHAQSCQSQFRQPRSVSRPNQINLFKSDLGHEGFSRLCHGSQSSPVISSGQAMLDFCSCIAIACHYRHVATVFCLRARITLEGESQARFQRCFCSELIVMLIYVYVKVGGFLPPCVTTVLCTSLNLEPR